MFAATKSTRRNQSKSRPLAVETLGDRSLMSAGLTGTTLNIAEGSMNDTVTVQRVYFEDRWYVKVTEQSSDGVLTYAPRTSWFDQSKVTKIAADLASGNDTFKNETAIRTSIRGGSGNDTMFGGTGVDTFYGDSGNDVLQGGRGNDRLEGGSENDRIFGGSGYDYLYGQAGNDFLDDGGGSNYLAGGEGLDFNARVTALRGATMNDVNQDASPTCGCLASIGAVARTGANLSSLITYLGVGDTGITAKYQVKLHDGDRWRNHIVEFDGTLITGMVDGATRTFDAVPVTDNVSTNKGCEQQSWVTILQRAYLQKQGVNWRSPRAIDENGRCDPEEAMTAFNGKRTIQYDAGFLDSELDREDRIRIINSLRAGKAVVAGTFDEASDLSTEKLVRNHAYTVIRTYTRFDGMTMFVLRNPWAYDGGTDKNGNGRIDGADSNPGDALVEVTWDGFKKSVEDYWVNG